MEFAQYSQHMTKQSLSIEFNHPQIPIILDTLSRHEQHHIALAASSSGKMNAYLLTSIANYCTESHVIYLDTKKLTENVSESEKMIVEFKQWLNQFADHTNQVIFAINDVDWLTTPFGKTLKEHANLYHWRLILIEEAATILQHRQTLTPYFEIITLIPNSNLMTDVLKANKHALETIYHMTISDEACLYAYTAASHYLGGASLYDSAWKLLSSGALRAQAKAAPLTPQLLMECVADWTHIPLAHLQQNMFKASRLSQTLQQQVHGQEAAINWIGSVLQQACLRLIDNAGPLARFIFAGPSHSGKSLTAQSIAMQLFGHKNALLTVSTHSFSTLDEVLLQPTGKTPPQTLLSAIQDMPYAIVLLDNIAADQWPIFSDILTQGIAFDQLGRAYDFRRAIVIMTTVIDAASMTASAKPTSPANQSNDLLNLMMNDITTPKYLYASIQDICNAITPRLSAYLPQGLLAQCHIIPFLPLDAITIEKLIQEKLIAFVNNLKNQYAIELTYTADVTRFLTQLMVQPISHALSLDTLFEKYVYACVAHPLMLRLEGQHQGKRLQLQLNDSGQLLRCEFLLLKEFTGSPASL